MLAAAALCLVACCADAEDLCRKLLIGPDPLSPSKVSQNARYHLIKAMGVSGDSRLVGLLGEALWHPHFCPGSVVAQALDRLGEPLDEDQLPFHRSISVSQGLGGIVIGTDERYAGGSNCVTCRFFPCRINRYYAGGIEDCALWNRVDPKDLGEFIDQRDWGHHQDDEDLERRSPEDLLMQAQSFLRQGKALAAIPLLCEIVVDSELQSALQPVVWIDLALCFSAFGEPLLAFVAMREAARTPNLIGLSHPKEYAELSLFVDNPEKVFGRKFPSDRRFRFELRAEGYKQKHLYTQALDCYAMAAICEGDESIGIWFEMGDCFKQLGERWLAELFLRKGAFLARHDITLRERFLHLADAVRVDRPQTDPGLDVDRRQADRAESDPLNLCVVDPVE